MTDHLHGDRGEPTEYTKKKKAKRSRGMSRRAVAATKRLTRNTGGHKKRAQDEAETRLLEAKKRGSDPLSSETRWENQLRGVFSAAELQAHRHNRHVTQRGQQGPARRASPDVRHCSHQQRRRCQSLLCVRWPAAGLDAARSRPGLRDFNL